MHPILVVAVALSLALAPDVSATAVEPRHGLATAPVAGPVVRQFAPPSTRYAAGHRGVDLAAAAGEPVTAAMPGRVTFAGSVAGVGWVTVSHEAGLETTYGPLAPRTVRAGQIVDRGEVIGFLEEAASHLDWGARLDGEYIDPLSLLALWEAHLVNPDDEALRPSAAVVHRLAATVPAGRLLRPVTAPVSSAFGPRRHPVTGADRMHAGLDFAAAAGTPVRAADAGRVTFAGVSSGYGNTVIVDHGGRVTTLYAHLSAISVRPGQRVAAGAHIGAVGATGIVTGAHLHFEVRADGVPQDPDTYLSR